MDVDEHLQNRATGQRLMKFSHVEKDYYDL